jgi:hypothetical protein
MLLGGLAPSNAVLSYVRVVVLVSGMVEERLRRDNGCSDYTIEFKSIIAISVVRRSD